MSTQAELHRLFEITRKVGLDGARWIQMARERCAEAEEDLGWDWFESGNDLTYSVNLPKMVNCSYIESIIDSEVPDHSKALVFHPTLSTYVQEHPNFDPFILPSDNDSF
jgi:hypothetical protein